jgi:hypothetical protein
LDWFAGKSAGNPPKIGGKNLGFLMKIRFFDFHFNQSIDIGP